MAHPSSNTPDTSIIDGTDPTHPPIPQQPETQDAAAEDEEMQRALAESLEEQKRFEEEKHRYDEYQEQGMEWKYEDEGPEISPLRPTSEIAVEFATADPYFVVKTKNLTSTHKYWRKSKGDGNCGWRALTYSYFLLLLRTCSASLITSEVARLKSLSTQFEGAYESTYELFGEDAIEAMEELRTWVEEVQGEKVGWEEVEVRLERRWRGETLDERMVGMNVLQFFRTLTMYHMSSPLNQPRYSAFLLADEFPAYLSSLTQSATEIDELGLSAMAEVLLWPAGFGLRVYDLNRSVGESVDVVEYLPEGKLREKDAVVQLLFRPGHYDIVYEERPGPFAA